MAPGRVMALTPDEGMLKADEAANERVTRQKASAIARANQLESQLQSDAGFHSVDEEDTVLVDHSHNAPAGEQQQLMRDEGKFSNLLLYYCIP